MAQGNKEHNFLPVPNVFTNYITTVPLSLGRFSQDVVYMNFRFRPYLDSPLQ